MNVLKPHKRTTIFTLLGLGKSQRDIERITGIDRKTIRSYQRRYEAQRSNSPGVARNDRKGKQAFDHMCRVSFGLELWLHKHALGVIYSQQGVFL